MAVWHSMDADDSHDISLEEFVTFCLQLHHLPATPRKKKKRASPVRRNSAPYPSKARSSFSRTSSVEALSQSQSVTSLSRSRSLSPAMRRSVSRLHSDAEFYTKKKERFKEELARQEEEYLHDTRDKWRNDMIRHRITGSPQHHPNRIKSAPRSTVKVGVDLYAKDMKWKECRQKSLDALAATIKEKKAEEEEEPTFQPKLATEEFNVANQISSVVWNEAHTAFMQETAEQRQQQQSYPGSMNLFPDTNNCEELFRPKISHRSELLAQRRRMTREAETAEDLLSHHSVSPPHSPSHSPSLPAGTLPPERPQQQQQKQQQKRPEEGRGTSSVKSAGSGSGQKRAKSPSLFVHLYQVSESCGTKRGSFCVLLHVCVSVCLCVREKYFCWQY
jgi:hypothetical protein